MSCRCICIQDDMSYWDACFTGQVLLEVRLIGGHV